MTKTRSVRSALFTSVVSLFLCVAMLVGTTFAWFTDSVTSGQNVIKSGTLDIKLEYSVLKDGNWTDYAEVTSTTDIFGYENWEPGHVSVAKFRITNVGSLAIKYNLTADVYSETAGINVNGDEFLLSDYLYTAVVEADATRDEILATTGNRLKAPINDNHVVNDDLIVSTSDLLAAGEIKEVALAIWMPTTVGNEANYRGVQPAITFGINLVATQAMSEADSFDNTYDADTLFPTVAFGATAVERDENGNLTQVTPVIVDLLKADGGKVGSLEAPIEALAEDAQNVGVIVHETAVDSTVEVASDDEARTFNITVTGIKEGNTAPIKVELDVGMGLTGVKIFHKDVEITDADYNPNTGNVIFVTTSFSPYTVTYDAVATEIPETDLINDVPVAIVTDADEYENVAIAWQNYGGLIPSNANQQLNAVYKFAAPHDSETVENSKYKDWYCDYYVMLESDKLDTLPEGAIVLGGNYGTFGWVGFDNPEVPTNDFIPLLGSVTKNPWTYEAVVGFVGEFLCGVGVADTTELDITDTDAKFVVQLRVTNPDNADEFFVCNEVIYTFSTGASTSTGYQAQ